MLDARSGKPNIEPSVFTFCAIDMRRSKKSLGTSATVVRRRTSAKRDDLIEKLRSGEFVPEQARYIAVTDVLNGLPNDLLRGLAELADIPHAPQARRRSFYGCVLDALWDCWNTREDIDAELYFRKNGSFANAIDALKSARQALAQIDASDRRAFFWPVAMAEQGMDYFLTALGELEPARPLRRRGKPPGKVKDSASHKFVLQLLKCAILHGGRLSFDKNVKEGALIEALNKLTPYLPQGVDPGKLSASTLQRIKDAASRAARQRHPPLDQ